MKCPKCQLINPDSALRCDCGYDFSSGEMKESYLNRGSTRDRNENLLTTAFSIEGKLRSRFLLGLAGRAVFWLGFLFIVGHSVSSSYEKGDYSMVLWKLLLFPMTFLVYPWFSGFGWLLIISLVGYWVSTFIGRMNPVD
jgi:hypothetical protein